MCSQFFVLAADVVYFKKKHRTNFCHSWQPHMVNFKPYFRSPVKGIQVAAHSINHVRTLSRYFYRSSRVSRIQMSTNFGREREREIEKKYVGTSWLTLVYDWMFYVLPLKRDALHMNANTRHACRRSRRSNDDEMYRTLCSRDIDCELKTKPNLLRKCSKFGFCHEDRGWLQDPIGYPTWLLITTLFLLRQRLCDSIIERHLVQCRPVSTADISTRYVCLHGYSLLPFVLLQPAITTIYNSSLFYELF